MTDKLRKLIEEARLHAELHPLTAEEHRAQVISFAYGNLAIENPSITREMVEREYDKLWGKHGERSHEETVLISVLAWITR